MPEFKLPPRMLSTQRHDVRILWLVSMPALVLAFGILFFIGFAPHSLVHRVGPLLVWALVLIVVCIVATPFVMLRRKLERVRQDLTYVLDQDELTRRMSGRPDVRIAVQQIQSLYEQSEYLVVTGGDPARRIAVPRKVENFELLQTELLKYAPLSCPPWSYRLKLRWAALLLYIICGVLLIWSENVSTIRTAATVFVILLGWESFKIHRLFRRSTKRIVFWLFWLMMGSVWLSTGFLIYIRVFGGRL